MQQILLGKQNIALGHGHRNYLWKLLRDLWLFVGIWAPRISHRLGPLVASMDVCMLLGKPNIALGHGPQSSLWVWPRVLGRLVAIWLPRPSHCLGPLVASMDVHLLLGKPNIALGHGPQSSGQSRENPISPSPWNSFVLNGYGEKMSHMMSHIAWVIYTLAILKFAYRLGIISRHLDLWN